MVSASDLSEEQKERIREWAAEGATLGEIQGRFVEEFKLSMKYFEARMLIMDLGISLVEEKEESEPAAAEAGDEASEEGGEPGEVKEGTDVGASGVTVTMNEVTPPGMVASGKVTFSDGETAEWYFDQMGRLGLNPAKEEYRPSEADVRSFQEELQRLAKREGL